MRKTIKHKVYSIEEKNKIVERYLNGETGFEQCLRIYDIASRSVLSRWIKQVRTSGTTIDHRGKSKPGDKPKGRPRKVNLNSLSKVELISIIGVYEDIKKTMAYLRQQKRSIKSSMN